MYFEYFKDPLSASIDLNVECKYYCETYQLSVKTNCTKLCKYLQRLLPPYLYTYIYVCVCV